MWTKTAFLNYACKQHNQFRYPFGNEKTHRRDTSFKCVCAPVSRHSLCVFVAGCTWYECSSECHLSTVYSAVCLSGIMKNQIIFHGVKPLITTRNSKFIVVLILNQTTSLCWSASISNEKLTWKQVDENGEKIPLKPIP